MVRCEILFVILKYSTTYCSIFFWFFMHTSRFDMDIGYCKFVWNCWKCVGLPENWVNVEHLSENGRMTYEYLFNYNSHIYCSLNLILYFIYRIVKTLDNSVHACIITFRKTEYDVWKPVWLQFFYLLFSQFNSLLYVENDQNIGQLHASMHNIVPFVPFMSIINLHKMHYWTLESL